MESCPRCAGRREINVIERASCEWCNGSGFVMSTNNRYNQCRVCEGRGVVVEVLEQMVPCHYCTDTLEAW